jgi:hypothetical protein
MVNPSANHNCKYIAALQWKPKTHKAKLIELKGSSRVIAGDFNTPLAIADRTTRQIKKCMEHLNSTVSQSDLADIYRTHTHHPTAGYIFIQEHLEPCQG